MRSLRFRAAAVVLGTLIAATGMVALADPAKAANATVLYRSTSGIRFTTPNRSCAPFASPPFAAELSSALQVGGSNANANARTILCVGGGSSLQLLVAMGETISWNASRVATAQHWVQIHQGQLFSGNPAQVCVPVTPDPQSRIRIGSQQQGTVTSEFNHAERYLATTRAVTCPTLGRINVTISLFEGWAAVA